MFTTQVVQCIVIAVNQKNLSASTGTYHWLLLFCVVPKLPHCCVVFLADEAFLYQVRDPLQPQHHLCQAGWLSHVPTTRPAHLRNQEEQDGVCVCWRGEGGRERRLKEREGWRERERREGERGGGREKEEEEGEGERDHECMFVCSHYLPIHLVTLSFSDTHSKPLLQ